MPIYMTEVRYAGPQIIASDLQHAQLQAKLMSGCLRVVGVQRTGLADEIEAILDDGAAVAAMENDKQGERE